MVPGDPALRDLKPGDVVDIVVAPVAAGLFKGLWHGDLFSCDGLESDVWTLFGYEFVQALSGVGQLRETSSSTKICRPPLRLQSFRLLKELCSGIGCISVGTSFAGCKTLLSTDISKIACDTVSLNGGLSVQGDIRDRTVRIQVVCSHASERCLYSAGFPCNSYSPQGNQGGLADPRGQVLCYILQTVWHAQAAGVLLECVQQVEDHPDTMALIASVAERMQFTLTTVCLDLANHWCSRRCRWWAVMLPLSVSPLVLRPWPIPAEGPCVEEIMPEWPVWPMQQEQDLLWTDTETAMYSNPEFGNDSRRLNVKGQAPTALHSWGVALTSCPCGCRSAGFSHANLASKGLRGFGVLSGLLPGLRFPHPAEVGLLNSLPVTFKHLEDARAALCLVGQLAAPMQALWVYSQIRAWAEDAYHGDSVISPQGLLESFKSLLHNSRKDCLKVPSLSNASRLSLTKDGQPYEVVVHEAIRAGDLIAAERKLLGPGHIVKVYEGNRLLAPEAFLHPDNAARPYQVKAHEKKASKTKPLLAPSEPPRATDFVQVSPQGASDVAVWCGLLRLQAAAIAKRAFVVPPAIAKHWIECTASCSEHYAPFTWPDCEVCLVPFVYQGHWTLLSFQPNASGDLQVIGWDGIPGRNAAISQALASFVCSLCGVALESFSERSPLLQTDDASCGAVLLAHAGLVLYSEEALLANLFADAKAFMQNMPPHTALLWGTGGLSEGQTSELRKILCERGVPENAVEDRLKASVEKIGPGPISKALQAANVWQALKAAGSAPGSLFRWIRPEELKLHAQAKAHMQFGAAVSNAKARKQKSAKGPKPVLHVDPTALLIAPDSFTTKDGARLPQLAFTEVGPQSQGVAFCTPAQFQPFLQDYRPISVDALAIISTAPIPPEVVGGAPVTQIRFPAVYSPTQEAVLISGSLLQLGDDHVQLKASDTAMEDIEQPDTLVGRLSLYKDESDIPWGEVIKAPIRALLRHVPGLQLCQDSACKGDCQGFHAAVDESVDQLLLDIWSRHFCRTDGSRVPAAQAELFQVLVRVPSSACRHLQKLAPVGIYFEPRAGEGAGPHPSYSVVWLPGKDKGQAAHALRTCDKALGLARLGHKYGLRTRDCDEEGVFKSFHPGSAFLKLKITSRWKLHPLPHGFQRKHVGQLLAKWGWHARALQPCKGDASGCAWEVGSDSEPPSTVVAFGENFILIHKVKDLGGQARAAPVCASSRTRQHILYDDPESSDPWSHGRDPWSLSKPPGLPAPPTTSTSQTETKLSQLKTELQAGVEGTVQRQVQLAVANAEPGKAVDNRLRQLEVGLQEVRQQNQKFEEWFNELGSQTKRTAAQVAEVQQSVAGQQAELQKVKGDVASSLNKAIQTLQQDMSQQLAQQTSTVEALLSKKHRSE